MGKTTFLKFCWYYDEVTTKQKQNITFWIWPQVNQIEENQVNNQTETKLNEIFSRVEAARASLSCIWLKEEYATPWVTRCPVHLPTATPSMFCLHLGCWWRTLQFSAQFPLYTDLLNKLNQGQYEATKHLWGRIYNSIHINLHIMTICKMAVRYEIK